MLPAVSFRPACAVLRNEFMFRTRIEIKVVAYKPLEAGRPARSSAGRAAAGPKRLTRRR